MIKDFIAKYDRKTLIRGGFALLVYLLWVIWLGNYWFLIGLPIVFDIYFTKKVNWSPWKSRKKKNHVLIEWLDALIFAVIAVTIINIFLFQNYKIPTGSMEKSLQIGDHLYVSKVAYGPRIPMTPLALPFMQHSLPGSTKKSYLEWPKWDYKRIKGFGKVERWDPVVFNFPAGDTVCLDEQNRSYDAIVRDRMYHIMNIDQSAKKPMKTFAEYDAMARKAIRNERDIIVRPIDKKDNYIKRCVAIPGDSLEIRDGVLMINGEKEPEFNGRQYNYTVITTKSLNVPRLMEFGIYSSDIIPLQSNQYSITMTKEIADKIRKFKSVVSVEKHEWFSQPDHNIFPYNYHRSWSQNNFGPIYIPEAGKTVELKMDVLPFYDRIIKTYEGNKLEVKDSVIYINGEIADSYTFKMDYYWMMGDNRNSSLDSRFWGYVPEDHIIGKPKFIWLSLHKEKRFPGNIQLRRMFRKIK